MTDTLFELTPEPNGSETSETRNGGQARMRSPIREQMEMRVVSLDDLLPPDHQARVVWDYVQRLDLSELHEKIKAVEGHAGRTPVDPAILLALWLYATLDGVGSARELDRLCREHVAYQWICGGVPMNYHTLSDFRTQDQDFLNRLLTQGVGGLLNTGLVKMERVAQDGMRVRASAGAASFRREERLKLLLEAAAEQVKRLSEEVDQEPGMGQRRKEAARQRAVRERHERIVHALEEMQELKAEKKESPRVSTTDPEARVMKMADGGFRPAYNVELATDTETQIIVGVDLTNRGSDQGQLAPMVEQLKTRYAKGPGEMLVDGGFAQKADIETLAKAASPCKVYAPPWKPKTAGRDEYTPRDGDSAAVAEWKVRMGTTEAKAIYKERAATAECVNAIARNRGLQQFRVRGKHKALTVVLWYALAHNLMRSLWLQAQKEVKLAA